MKQYIKCITCFHPSAGYINVCLLTTCIENLRKNLGILNHSRIWCEFGSFIVRDIRGAIVHSHEEQLITHGDLILLCHREKRKTTISFYNNEEKVVKLK